MGIGLKYTQDSEIACINCGASEHLVMYPHRHGDDKPIVGLIFTCPNCESSLVGAEVNVTYLPKESEKPTD